MNRNHKGAAPRATKEPAEAPLRRRLKLNTILLIGFACAFFAVIFLFASSYASLQRAIQQERIDYVTEISNQLITGHHFMMEEYTSSVLRYAGIIDRSEAECLEDIAACFIPDDASRIMLINEAGRINDLNAKSYFTTDRQIAETLSQNDGVTQLFASLNNEADYWLFATAINPLEMDGQRYRTIVLAIPASRFHETLAVSLFGSRGASYIISGAGGIELKPDDASTALGGYNLFSSLRQTGASEKQVAQLEAAVRQRQTGSLLMDIQGQDWLFGYNNLDEDNAIVVAIPLTLTAARTYSGLSNTMLYMATAIMLMALIALTMMMRFYFRDKERNRLALAAQVKSSFFSKMSHDIRTPLNAVIGLQTLIAESTDMAAVQAYNQKSRVASSYLLSILNDVLDMSRIESGGIPLSHDAFDMNGLLSEVSLITSSMAEEKKVSFSLETDSRFETLYVGDAVRIKQVTVNLLSNAVKFTKPGGWVSMTVKHRRKSSALDEVEIAVRDNGIGMSEAYLARIFTPFAQEHSSFTQQYPGSGLGLSIVHNLVQKMGGTIDVKSELGKGSVFTVKLPLERGAEASDAPEKGRDAKEDAPTFPGKRVLLAEDIEINQIVAANLLSSKFGIQVDVASDGQEALHMFERSEPGYYDMILMDIKMPKMDGLEATRAIRMLPRPDAAGVPIIALSANAYAEDAAQSFEAGMNDHLSKPIDVGALSNTLGKLLGEERSPL